MNNMMRLAIVGTNSGCGKTTMVLALESAFIKRGLPVTAFKCGPDYIDGAFHRRVQHIDCYNLDSIFLKKENLKEHFVKHSVNKFSIIEGVMGMFDGVGAEDKGSSFEIAQTLSTPTVLVVNARGMSSSVRALIRGFKDYSNNTISGVIFTNISTMIYPMMREYCKAEGIKCFGFLPRDEKIVLESRHLGLIGSGEIENLNDRIDYLSELAEKYIELDELMELANSAPPIELMEKVLKEKLNLTKKNHGNLRIAIAKDDAFCFTYQENLELMETMGLELVFFSPLSDKHLPHQISALYLPGGYPELHLDELSGNKELLGEIKEKIECGLPTLAECGGFLYLHSNVDDKVLVSLFDGSCTKEDRLQHFGYGHLVSNDDNLLFKKGESALVHEFHYYCSTDEGDGCVETKLSSGKQHHCALTSTTMFAGFPHFYFPSNPKLLERWIEQMNKYNKRKYKNGESN
jgi:cobyrinic acid a,c-diamide synthase